MIKKERTIPHKILQLQALQRRLPAHHPKLPQIEEELARRIAGHRGEQALDYYLLFLDPRKYDIYHGLRLTDQTSYFQIDTMIVSPAFILLIEIKNISGTIYFDGTFDQMLRTKEGKETGFSNPLLQIKRHELQFDNWLHLHKLVQPPLEPFVVISNPSTIIKASNQHTHFFEKIIHSASLLTKIEQLEKRHPTVYLKQKDNQKLSTTLLKQHTPAKTDILEQLNISEAELIKGVHCPKCLAIPMLRSYGKWSCPKCTYAAKDAHLPSLKDYTLLVNSTITNSKLRHFLQLSSRNISTDLLQSLNVSITGKQKGTTYRLDDFF
ncbi:hypothetical protein JCM9140_4626 [Halalkalibacter wakoensis JCM 9140]|uniref:NERD domain-containing protein n=1 Tax=Halalkalibacter wakoensis JCM 9140 TaxID=1236970 RepID=W4Q8V7_9BACI|nr:nuclease-related domain-containing protein [Halalkalibacter wakoensis]GAE28402.1 hypothetical protein JCM9140_4626 [Halalkalibacter wakoensis JCM 9140]